MRKIYLQKIIQHDTVCYTGKADPRDLVKVSTKIEMGEVQDAQRPLSKKRVKEIANYVFKSGILPNALTLATKDSTFDVKRCNELEDIYYIEFPNTKEEFSSYKNTIDVMDGQHRLYSFLDDLRTIKDDVKYEIGFTLYIQPTIREKRKIFISCNEKQEKVSGNLLMWFKEKLQMLNDEDSQLFSLVKNLNDNTPLKGHIIMGGERIVNGIKAKELIAILKTSGLREMSVQGKKLTNDNKFDIIRKYLFAWEKVVGFSFSSPRKEDGPATKISGIRYMLSLLPYIWTRTMELRINKNGFEDFFIKTITELISAHGTEKEKFFKDNKLYFRDRTATEELTKQSIKELQNISTENFNPFG